MPLSGVEIFKYLPKTNCKKCGYPTCLAFAMKLAAKQAELSACPDVSEEAKKVLGEAAAPPIRSISIGTGDRAVKVGEEIVLFRHEKKFVKPCAFALAIEDTINPATIEKKVEEVRGSEIDRVGQKLRVDMVAVVNRSGDPERFSSAVKTIMAKTPEIPLILHSLNPSALEAGLAHCDGKRPLIYAATAENAEVIARIAKDKKASLVVSAENLDALSTLTEKIKGMGVDDIVLDPGVRGLKEMLRDFTLIRRAAIKKFFKPLGYPVIAFAQQDDPYMETITTSVAITKYASIVVLSGIEKWKMFPLLTLRQNIYTDPQVPMQVEQKVYKVGEPTEKSPLIVTTNFSLTYFIVQGEVENSKIPCWLAIMNVDGLSVLTAWAAGKFTAANIAKFIQESETEKLISHRELIIPGYVSILSGSLEEKLGNNWKVIVGPREANGLPSFLKGRCLQ